MLIDLGGKIINTDLIRSVEERPDPAGGHHRLTLVVWADGTREPLDFTINRFMAALGTLVPAPSGYLEITSWSESGKVGFHDPVPVIAFRISGGSNYDIMPVTMNGEVSQYSDTSPSAIILPDGRCCEIGGDTTLPMPLELWKAGVTMRLLKAQ